MGVLTLPSLLSAYSESRPPRAAAILVLISGVLITVALSRKTNGYAIQDIPEVFMSVFNRYLG